MAPAGYQWRGNTPALTELREQLDEQWAQDQRATGMERRYGHPVRIGAPRRETDASRRA